MNLWFVTYNIGKIGGVDQPVVTGEGTVDAVKTALRDFHNNFNVGDAVEISKAVLVGRVAFHGVKQV